MTSVQIQDDEDLKNTEFDCRQCHQRATQRASLLMRENKAPWTHFFEPLSGPGQTETLPGVRGSELMRAYLDAKGDEAYGGIDVRNLVASAGFALEDAAGEAQPLVFDAPMILSERDPDSVDWQATEPQPSPTWNAAYEALKGGEQLALPYVDARVVDPQKQATLSDAYARYRAGDLRADDLPDLSDIFPNDPQTCAQIGLQIEPDATPAEAPDDAKLREN